MKKPEVKSTHRIIFKKGDKYPVENVKAILVLFHNFRDWITIDPEHENIIEFTENKTFDIIEY